MNITKNLNTIKRKIKQYIKKEYGTTNITISFARDIYEQHHIFITITFFKVCDELFAEGRDHKELINFINNLFIQTFGVEWTLQRITLLKDQSTGKIIIHPPSKIPLLYRSTTQIATILTCTQKV